MRSTRKALTLMVAMALMGVLSLACLYTRHDIHITLDIRHIQQTASNIEDVVSGEKDLKEIKPTEGSMLLNETRDLLARLLDPSTVSYAQGSGSAIREMTPKLEKAIKNRRDRADKIRQYKSKGAIGENKVALLEVRSAGANADDVKTLVADENRDRNTIYEEIARQNGKTSIADITEIQQAWAEVNRAKSKPGDWIQVPTDAKYLRNFLRSALAADLEEKPEPGSWIQVPKSYSPQSD